MGLPSSTPTPLLPLFLFPMSSADRTVHSISSFSSTVLVYVSRYYLAATDNEDPPVATFTMTNAPSTQLPATIC